MRTLLALLLLSLHLLHASTAKDPYEAIKHFTLSNGLEVYMLSNAKAQTTQIEVEVKVGMEAESEENYGISHLVEHLVFRDQRIPHHDYLDYITELGATYINAYTRRYTTTYSATIDSNQSYQIAEIFAKMLFDKNVTKEDLEIEKKALQTEIGAFAWYTPLLYRLGSTIKHLTPPQDHFFFHHIGIKEPRELPPHYLMQKNNPHFTLPEVMEHYQTYYYPANMTLKIVGNFDNSTMREVIEQAYGSITHQGSKTLTPPKKHTSLANKPFKRYYEGTNRNYGYLGISYLLEDCTSNIILSAYMESLAKRIQQELRNKEGKTYSVNSSQSSNAGVAIATITFDGLHEEFQGNIDYIQTMLQQDPHTISDEEIAKALKSYSTRYLVEHDSDSLLSLINTTEHLKEDHNITNQSHYQLFESITPEQFRNTIASSFVPQHRYTYIFRDYYLFPFDMILLSITTLVLWILLYLNLFRDAKLTKQGILSLKMRYQSYRLSNRFIGFLTFFIISFIANLLWAWISYALGLLLTGDRYYLHSIDLPYSLLATLINIAISIGVFMLLYRHWFYYSTLKRFEHHLVILGSRYIVIEKEEIVSIEVVPYRFRDYRHRIGFAFAFWRPLVKISLKSGTHYTLRSNNAYHLCEELIEWKEA
jgi:zinc protease